MTTATTIDELPSLTRQDLQKLCKTAGIESDGTNEELITGLKGAVESGKISAESLTIVDAKETEDKETEDKEAELADEDTQVNTVAATPKDTATPTNESVADPAPTPKDPEPQTPQMSKKIAAELEERAAALASGERKAAIESFDNQRKADDGEDAPKSAETPSMSEFDKAHEKLFEKDDSIAAHWSTKHTPKNKRVGEPIEQESSKRQKIEPLFKTPVKAPAKERAATRAVSAKVTRVKPAAAATTGSKTVAVGRTTRAGRGQLTSTTLFADAKKPTENASRRVTRKAPLPKWKPAKPAETASSEKLTVEKIVEKALEKQAPVQGPMTPKKKNVAERIKTPRKPAVAEDRPVTRSMSPRKPAAKPTEPEAPATPARKPPVPRRIATPKSKLPAARKAPTKPTTHPIPDLSHVESKVKAFINKPVERKQKREDKPKRETKRIPKPTAKPAAMKPANTEKTEKTKADDDNNIPHYMKSTRAAEGRSKGAHAKPQPPIKDNATAKERGTRARAAPYKRPANPRTAAKTAEKKV